MIDTIVMTMHPNQFQIRDYEKFSPSARGLFESPYYKLGARGNFACYLNPTKTELEQGLYLPRLTLTKRYKGFFEIKLKIEFSAPKLIRGNNFDELTDYDFDELIQALLDKLEYMGVETNYEMLAMAEISAIHYSKNIPLTDYSSCSMVINEMRKLNLNRKLDLNGTDYRNEGQAIRFHANSFEVIFYDKIKDLKQSKTSEKRAIERDSKMQQDLFAKASYPKQFEVLRMEVRIGNRVKLKAIMTQLNITAKTTFSGLYDEKIAQKILLHYWKQVTDGLAIIMMTSDNPSDLFAQLVKLHKKPKPSKILVQLASILMIEQMGVRGFQNRIADISNARTGYRLKSEISKLRLSKNPKFMAVNNIQKCLEEFKPLRLADYALDKKMAGGGYVKAQMPLPQHSNIHYT